METTRMSNSTTDLIDAIVPVVLSSHCFYKTGVKQHKTMFSYKASAEPKENSLRSMYASVIKEKMQK